MLAICVPAEASIQEIRVVAAGVDTSSLQAQEKAIDYARKRAVYLAAKKLNVPDAGKVVSKFADSQYDEIIRGVNVVQTTRKGEVTYCEVNVSIVDDALLRALRLPARSDAPPQKLRGVLVLSVYAAPDRAYMWEKENELRPLLNDELRRQSHAGLLLPGADLADLRLIDYQNALTVKPEELQPMFDRYGANEIIIAIMTPSAPGTMSPSKVLLRRLNIDHSQRNEALDVPPDTPEETAAIRLQKTATAIASAVTQIASSTSEEELKARAKAKQIKLRFSYTIPRDLARMQEAVRNSPQVLYLELPSIELAQVTGTIYLKGNEDALREELTKQGIIIRSINEGWRLSIR